MSIDRLAEGRALAERERKEPGGCHVFVLMVQLGGERRSDPWALGERTVFRLVIYSST